MPLLSGGAARSRRGGGGDGGFVVPRRPPVVVDIGCGCGCGCRRPRLLGSLLSSLTSRALGQAAKPKSPHASSSSTTTTAAFSSSTGAGATTATTISSADSWGPATYTTNTLYEDVDAEARLERRRRRRQRRRRTRREQEITTAREEEDEEEEAVAVAVTVESTAPYEDFRESMMAMVVEKEMYAWEELNALLHRFLSLNSPRHHPLILHAFADLWAPRGGLFAPPSPCLGL